jgi:hypothetical protein
VVHGEPTVGLGPHVELQLADSHVELSLQRRERRLVAVVRAADLHVVHSDDPIAWELVVARRPAPARGEQRQQQGAG